MHSVTAPVRTLGPGSTGHPDRVLRVLDEESNAANAPPELPIACAVAVGSDTLAHADSAGQQLHERFEQPLTPGAVESLVGSPVDAATLAVLRELRDDLDDDPLGRAWRRVIAAADTPRRQDAE